MKFGCGTRSLRPAAHLSLGCQHCPIHAHPYFLLNSSSSSVGISVYICFRAAESRVLGGSRGSPDCLKGGVPVTVEAMAAATPLPDSRLLSRALSDIILNHTMINARVRDGKMRKYPPEASEVHHLPSQSKRCMSQIGEDMMTKTYAAFAHQKWIEGTSLAASTNAESSLRRASLTPGTCRYDQYITCNGCPGSGSENLLAVIVGYNLKRKERLITCKFREAPCLIHDP